MIEDGNLHFLNVSYFFRLLYDLLTGAQGGGALTPNSVWAELVAFLSGLWLLYTILAFLASFAALAILIHSTIRMLETKRQEEPRYATVAPAVAEVRRDHSRWNHVLELIESANGSDWRQAIIEADIMLDDLLSQLGYHGPTVGEKLRAVDPSKFATLQDAWDAHRVRNEIAHQGMAYELTDHTAYRTIQRYENVMREHGEI